jgi:SAM-dependent methyltransferase
LTNPNSYDLSPYIAEVYDMQETYTDDVQLLRRLIGGRMALRILEPFCGTGRILVPLACAGHALAGIDLAGGMLARARAKVDGLPESVRNQVVLIQANVLEAAWPRGFDIVVLGGNCFYELSSPEEQERCVAQAAAALRAGGHVFIDNDHMEGDLDPAWQTPGVRQGAWPTGVCADGARLESTSETIWFDARRRLARFRRRVTVTLLGGQVRELEYVQLKHPVSTGEVHGWLERHGFEVEGLFGDRAGKPYTAASGRAIFWARKRA